MKPAMPWQGHGDAIQEDRVNEGRAAILNPAMFNAIDSVDFCGGVSRHLLGRDAGGEKGVRRCRSQPFRPEQPVREKLGPAHHLRGLSVRNQPLEREPQSYDGRCLQCHRAVGGSAVTGAHAHDRAGAGQRERCVACHMSVSSGRDARLVHRPSDPSGSQGLTLRHCPDCQNCHN